MQKIWFCSDYHFRHGRIDPITSERKGALNFRKHYSSVEEMDEAIITIHNSYVKPKDIVYHLGDFILSPKKTLSFRGGMNLANS